MTPRAPALRTRPLVAESRPRALRLSVHPLSADRWPDFVDLFGARGAYGGCWCMFFRLPRGEWSAGCGEGNKSAFRRIVKRGAQPGLLAYDGATPVGWCALAPREEYGALARSRILQPIDDAPVWSITCFYVARTHRRRGITVSLLKAAAKHVAAQGGTWLEGYPAEPQGGAWPDAYAYHGMVAAFTRAGFREVARPSKSRAIMRRRVRPARRAGQAKK
jgi:GNAT superfamily N-acetyltransferase